MATTAAASACSSPLQQPCPPASNRVRHAVTGWVFLAPRDRAKSDAQQGQDSTVVGKGLRSPWLPERGGEPATRRMATRPTAIGRFKSRRKRVDQTPGSGQGRLIFIDTGSGMGLVKAFTGAVGGTLGDQWKDFLTVPNDLAPTAALFPAVKMGTNAGRGSNAHGSQAVVSNGSKIVVPEGYGLLLFQDGELTSFTKEPGAYVWESDDINSQSVFDIDSVRRSLVAQSRERYRFGGRPSTQQLALFVRIKELPNNRFGTQSIVYWDDAYLNAQVGAVAHGTYSLRIVDPVRFATEYVPATYLQGQAAFDFTDGSNPAGSQLFSEIVSSLAAAFSMYTNDPSTENRITRIQQDSIGFAKALTRVVEDAYEWESTRGLAISKVTIVGVQYDEKTRSLLETVQRADALSGTRGNANLQASVAEGIQAAGARGGSDALLGLGIAAGSMGLTNLMQSPTAVEANATVNSESQDLLSRLEALKRALDAGLIEQSDFDAAKAKALGLS